MIQSSTAEVVLEVRDKIKRVWETIPVGIKSVLIGAHCWFIHPFYVMKAWNQLYGFPEIRVIIACLVHDLGYAFQSCRDMNGEEGIDHPLFGAGLMGQWFGPEFEDLCLYHSRGYCKKTGHPFSKLCVADKLSTSLTPSWIYLPMCRLTGELEEYMSEGFGDQNEEQWFTNLQNYLREWAYKNKDLAYDSAYKVERNYS
jgi:hypothetical protein